MRVKVEYIVGNPIESEWSGVYGYKPDNSEEIDFFSIMRLKADVDGASLDMIAKMLFDEVQTSFFDEENPERDLVLRLETAALKMKSKMDLILSREETLSKTGLDIEMAIAVVYQSYLYLGVVGESKIYIKRGDDIVEASQALTDGDMGGFLKSGSLEIEDTDRVVLATSKLTNATRSIENAISSLDIKNLNAATEITGAACILLADENDSWPIPETTQPIEEEVLPATEVVNEANEDSEINLEEPEVSEVEVVSVVEDGVLESENLTAEMDEIPPQKGKVSAVKAGLYAGGLGALNRMKNLRRKKDLEISEEPIEEEDVNRFTDLNQEEEVESSESDEKLHKKVIAKTAVLSASAKTKWDENWGPKLSKNNRTYMKFLRGVVGRITLLIAQVWDFFRRELFGTNDRRDRYLKGKSRSRNRKIAVAVLVVLVVVLFFGLRSADAARREQEIVDTAKKNVAALESRYNNLSSQVNQAKAGNEDKKTLIINELTTLSNDVNNQKKSGLFQDQLDQISENIQTSQDELLGVEVFTQAKILTDVGKTFPDAKLSDIVYSNGSVFISDEARNVVYKVSASAMDAMPESYVTGLKQPYILVKDAAGDIVFYDNDSTSALGKFGYNAANVTRFGQLSPASIGKPTESVIFEGNNALYELKAMNRQIFKRDKTGDTYVNGGAATSTDPSTNWRTDPDYANGIDIAAPYEIYVLITGQGVKRYYSKNENTLSFETYNNFLKKDYDSMSKATSFDVTGKYMAVGDPVNKRVMLFQIEDTEEKRITFVKQFVYRGSDQVFNNISEIAINEQDNSIYVLDSSKVIKLQI